MMDIMKILFILTCIGLMCISVTTTMCYSEQEEQWQVIDSVSKPSIPIKIDSTEVIYTDSIFLNNFEK